jgi:hypothetical protein
LRCTAMRRVHPELYYYKTKAGREVDFVVPARSRPQALIQVCVARFRFQAAPCRKRVPHCAATGPSRATNS